MPYVSPGRACLVAWVASCGGQPGDLDRDVVVELSRTRGSGEGTERSGRYPVTVTAVSCECPPAPLQPFDFASLCGPVLLQGQVATEIDVVETDGLLLVRAPGIGSLTGPIEADGDLSVGAVVDLGSPVSSGAIVLRADGSLQASASADSAHAPWALEATLRRRLTGMVGDESIDCTEIVSVESAP